MFSLDAACEEIMVQVRNMADTEDIRRLIKQKLEEAYASGCEDTENELADK